VGFLLGRKGSPEQNHGDVTTRTRIRTRVAKPTDVHYNQNAGRTIKKINFPPLSSHYTRMWYFSYYFLMWNHKASSRQTAAPLVSAVTSLTFSTSPQRLMDHSPPLRGHRPCPLHFSHNPFSQQHPRTSHIDVQLLRNGFITREDF